MIISLFGPDGVGKTTHADLLTFELTKCRYRVKRIWIKNNHTVAYLIITMLIHISRRNVIMLPSGTILTNIMAFSGEMSKRLWLWIDCLSVLVKLISVYIRRVFGYIIIADRYLPDTIVALTLTVRDLKILKTLPIKLLLSRLRKDRTIMVMLDCDYKHIRLRRKDTAEPQPLVLWQRITYRVLAKILNAPIIRTDKELSKVHAEILKLIKNLQLKDVNA